MFEWYASGQYSLDDIYERCRQDGFTARSAPAAPLARSKIKNPFYIGLFRWRGQTYPGTHEAIVSQELWDRVQAAFRSHGRSRGKYRVHDFAFGGLITCGACGAAVTAQIKKGRYVYYRCTRGHRIRTPRPPFGPNRSTCPSPDAVSGSNGMPIDTELVIRVF